MNRLFYGDNLDVLRRDVQAGTVDLIYLDPPFNSNRSYNVIFNRHDTTNDTDAAQIQAFDDTWRWTPVTEQQYEQYVASDLPNAVSDALRSFRLLLGENTAMAYLVNMAPRLVELHRVLKSTGSIFLHCDPVMSHYLKMLMDTIFGFDKFQNEIIWHHQLGAMAGSSKFPSKHDVLFWYSKGNKPTFNKLRGEVTHQMTAKYSHEDEGGKYMMSYGKKYYLKGGKPFDDVWDIAAIAPTSGERLGYPTQKPLALLERVILAGSNEGDVVLDPFCGCGTAIDAAIRAEREWLGIDITYIAVDLIEKRLIHTHGDAITSTYEVLGIPRDRAAALALFSRSPFDFERWAVSLVNGEPNQKQVGDKGIDGVARFPLGGRGNFGRALISVKGGRQLNPSMVRDLGGTVATQKAEMGVLITNGPATRGMTDEANHAGSYKHPHYDQTYPRIQIITVNDLLSGRKPSMPPTILPYIRALRAKTPADQGSLFDPDSN
jgi:DNA modification methylase